MTGFKMAWTYSENSFYWYLVVLVGETAGKLRKSRIVEGD